MDNVNITSAQYLAEDDTNQNYMVKAVINNEAVFVPLDPANRHYAEILRQVDAGELTIEEAD